MGVLGVEVVPLRLCASALDSQSIIANPMRLMLL